MPPFLLMVHVAFFLSYNLYFYMAHCSYSASPSFPLQAPMLPPSHPDTADSRPGSRPALSNRTFSSEVNVRPALSSVVAVSQVWLLSI